MPAPDDRRDKMLDLARQWRDSGMKLHEATITRPCDRARQCTACSDTSAFREGLDRALPARAQPALSGARRARSSR
jgi:hypothetical protein